MSGLHAILAHALHALEPERAHAVAMAGLRLGLGPRAPSALPRLETRLAGMLLPNPIGLAAGFDKNAAAPDALLRAGFGFVECGTVTPLPQAGNPRPRIFRLREDRAVINRLGFNNHGLDAFVRRLAARAGRPGVLGANIGANKDSADRIADYLEGLRRVWPFASYVTVNISSPNTPGLRGLQEGEALHELLGRLREARAPLTAAHGARPLFLKIAPDLDEQAIGDIVEAVCAHEAQGLIVSNTTLDRPNNLQARARRQAGGLSGRPLFTRATEALKTAARAARGRIALIGVGGVEGAGAALAKIKAGASAVQLYTAMIYDGPLIAARITQDLSMRLAAEGFRSVDEAVGSSL